MTTLSGVQIAEATQSGSHEGPPLVGSTYEVDGSKPLATVSLREVWSYRELLLFLTLRDLRVRYKQTLLGASWAVMQPLVQMGVMTIVLGYIAGLRNTTEVPYAVLTFCALVPWQLFSSALGNASNSLVGNERLVTKVYFPRLIIPAASILARLADFAVCMVVLALMMSVYILDGRLAIPGGGLLLLPLYTLWVLVVAFAAGLFFSALNVRWRDIGHLVPFLLQILMWVSGVYLASSIIPEKWRFYYHLNPIANIIDGYRHALLGQAAPAWLPTMISVSATLITLLLSLRFFRQAEETFADVI